jgi:hypothetical protein
MQHRDGRHVIVVTTVEVIERMIGEACDASLAEQWRRLASALPADSERASTLRSCADELIASEERPCLACNQIHPDESDELACPSKPTGNGGSERSWQGLLEPAATP